MNCLGLLCHYSQNQNHTVQKNRSLKVNKNHTETVKIAKSVTVGTVYTTQVGVAMNTAVGMMQAEEVGMVKKTIVGKNYGITAGEQFQIKVGDSSLILNADGSIVLKGNSIRIEAGKDNTIIGNDVHINPDGGGAGANEENISLPTNSEEISVDNSSGILDSFNPWNGKNFIPRELPLPRLPIPEIPNPRLPKPQLPKIELPKISISPLSSKINLSRPVTSAEMYAHYLLGNGESLNLNNLGATELVSNAIIKDGAFDKHGSIQSRFTRDIAEKFLEGNNDYSFLNGYDVGSEIGIWAFGSGDIGGKFVGSITQLKSGDISVIGEINYKYSDIFRDPYDIKNWVQGSWNPNGTPYNITGSIKHNVNTVVSLKDLKRK